MKRILYLSIFILLATSAKINAQGCVAVREMGGNVMCNTNSYNLKKGEFQIGTTYRYFHSFRHFIGRNEQPQRQTTGGGHDSDGKERGDAVNIYSHTVDLNLSYAITDRLQFNLTIPYVNNERSQVFKSNQTIVTATDTFRYSLHSKGLADIRFSTDYWIFNPATTTKGNLMIGAGIKLNSGSHSTSDMAPTNDAATKSIVYKRSTNDQAIQPGDGGIGFSIEFQGFTKLFKSIYGFTNGYYLFNPRQSNGTVKSPPLKSNYDKYACPDQYFLRAGMMTSVLPSKSLSLSLAGRFEGIPAYDIIGGQVAYRRPGYVVAIESGVSYRKGKHTFSLFIPYNAIKNRVQSAADIHKTELNNENTIKDPVKYPAQKPVHGDAAFADYSINVSYLYRIGKLF
jgi:hypothetical protein